MGYLPRDLLMNRGFVRRGCEELSRMAAELRDAPPLLVGVATPNPADIGRPLFNSAVLLRDGAAGPAFHKTLLPTYDVFDEDRYFEPAREPRNPGSERLALGHQHLRRRLERPRFLAAPPLPPRPHRSCWRERGAQAIVNLSASPFTVGKQILREQMLGHMARQVRLAAGLREPGGRQRRPDFRRPQRRLRRAGPAVRAGQGLRGRRGGGGPGRRAAGTIAEDDFDARSRNLERAGAGRARLRPQDAASAARCWAFPAASIRRSPRPSPPTPWARKTCSAC